jgi:hypothetical protein
MSVGTTDILTMLRNILPAQENNLSCLLVENRMRRRKLGGTIFRGLLEGALDSVHGSVVHITVALKRHALEYMFDKVNIK